MTQSFHFDAGAAVEVFSPVVAPRWSEYATKIIMTLAECTEFAEATDISSADEEVSGNLILHLARGGVRSRLRRLAELNLAPGQKVDVRKLLVDDGHCLEAKDLQPGPESKAPKKTTSIQAVGVFHHKYSVIPSKMASAKKTSPWETECGFGKEAPIHGDNVKNRDRLKVVLSFLIWRMIERIKPLSELICRWPRRCRSCRKRPS